MECIGISQQLRDPSVTVRIKSERAPTVSPWISVSRRSIGDINQQNFAYK